MLGIILGDPFGPWPSRYSRMNQPQPKGRRKPPLAGLSGSRTILVPPQPPVPLLQLLASDLAVSHGCANTGVTKLLLEHPDAVCRIVLLDGHHSEGISQAMGAYVVSFTRLWVDQRPQPRSISTFLSYLPCPMSVDAEHELLPFTSDWTSACDIVSKQFQRLPICR